MEKRRCCTIAGITVCEVVLKHLYALHTEIRVQWGPLLVSWLAGVFVFLGVLVSQTWLWFPIYFVLISQTWENVLSLASHLNHPDFKDDDEVFSPNLFWASRLAFWCICVFVFLTESVLSIQTCSLVYLYLCICVFVYLCICVFVFVIADKNNGKESEQVGANRSAQKWQAGYVFVFVYLCIW